MGSVLRSVKKRKKSRRLGEVSCGHLVLNQARFDNG